MKPKIVHAYEETIAEINMTPFVDIVLVILVIFMVTATFVSQGKIPLNLPKASSQEMQKEQSKPIVITLNEQGDLYYNDSAIAFKDLDEKIASLPSLDTKIILRSDAKTPFEYVVNVIDTCKKHQISSFAIQTSKANP